MKDQKANGKQPFFAQFLESQVKNLAGEVEGGQGGKQSLTSIVTDSITNPSFDAATSPAKDGHQTMKYPSDGDDTVLQ